MENNASLIKYAEHFSAVAEVPYLILDYRKKDISPNHNLFCYSCPAHYAGTCNYYYTHLYGCFEAERWQGRYVYYCPLGLIFLTSITINDLSELQGSLILGPIVMGNLEDTLAALDSAIRSSIQSAIEALPRFSTNRVNHLLELLSITVNQLNSSSFEFSSYAISLQNKLFNELYEVSESIKEKDDFRYPIEIEKQLQEMIISGDKAGSQQFLNKLLGYIFFSTNNNLKAIKARVLELLVLISRASIEGGADVQQIFWLNAGYLQEIDNLSSIEQLSNWLSRIMHRFINYAFDFATIKHSDIIHKATSYIKQNFQEKISLEDISSEVHLSKSYLCKVFKDEMQQNLSCYINKIRIEYSKQLLLHNDFSIIEIAAMSGFENQSYYTKVFKKQVGTSPGRFREARGKIIKH
ncbi:MAG: helix-turn-helix domain-containing protein [Clostridia bacterium]